MNSSSYFTTVRLLTLLSILFVHSCQGLKCGAEECRPGTNQCCWTSMYNRSTCCAPTNRDWMLKLSGMAFGAIGGLICIVIACSCCKRLKQRFHRNRNDVSPAQSHHGTPQVVIDDERTHPPSYDDVIAAEGPSAADFQEPPCYFKLYPVSPAQSVTEAGANNGAGGGANPAFEADEGVTTTVVVRTSTRTPAQMLPQATGTLHHHQHDSNEISVCTIDSS